MASSTHLFSRNELSRESHFHYATSPRWKPRARQILEHLGRLDLKPPFIHYALAVSAARALASSADCTSRAFLTTFATTSKPAGS